MTTLDKDRVPDLNREGRDLLPAVQTAVKGGGIKGGQVFQGTGLKAVLSDNQNCGGTG